MVKIHWLLTMIFLVSGQLKAACPETLLQKVCTEENVGSRRACLNDLKRQLESCIRGSEASIKNADKKVADAVKVKRDAAVGALDQTLSQGAEDNRRIERAFQTFAPTIKDIKAEYTGFARIFFQDYKPGENASAQELQELAKKLTSDSMPELVEAQYTAIAIGRTERDLAVKKAAVVNLLTFKATYIQDGIKRELNGLSTFVKDKGLTDLLYPFDEMLPTLTKMNKYVEERTQRYEKLVSKLDEDFETRMEIVKQKNVDAAIGEELKLGRYLSAVAQFMGEVEKAKEEAFKEDSLSPTYKVPTYSGQYIRLQNFIAYALICDNPDSPKWTGSGCLTYKRHADNAKRMYQGIGLSQLCIQAIAKIKAVNPSIPEEVFQRMRTLHKEKKFPDVIALHDTLLSIEPTP